MAIRKSMIQRANAKRGKKAPAKEKTVKKTAKGKMMSEFYLLSWGKNMSDIEHTFMGTMKIVGDKIVFDFKEERWLITVSSAPQEIIDGPALRYYDFVLCKFFHSTRIEVIEKED